MKIITAVLIILLISCRSDVARKLPYYDSPNFTPHFLERVPKDYHQVRSFSLVNQSGQVITEKEMDGKISVANFFFTRCPGICPRMAVNMKMLQDSFLRDDDILLLSHSVTPERDSVPVLQQYAVAKGVNERRWYLLTGEKFAIYDLGRKYYYVDEDLGQQKDSSEFLHTENFILVDKQRHLRGIYNGLNASSVRNLIADIRELKKED